MQFTFLGVRYAANISSIPVILGQIGGKYRGRFWLRKHFKKMLIPQSYYCLKYRGVKYVSAVYSRGEQISVSTGSKPTGKQDDLAQVVETANNSDNKKKVTS